MGSERRPIDLITRVKELALISLFSDDELMGLLVLKGGNAIALGYDIKTRVSADIDLSMESTFDAGRLDEICERIEYRLQQTFGPEGWVPFDVKLYQQPTNLTEDLENFWGGYNLEFKIIEKSAHADIGDDIDAMRRKSEVTGPGDRKKFEIDISRHEYCASKMSIDIDGYQIFVYTPQLSVCEKLRAICQQMPEYNQVVKRVRSVLSARPRDFFDIYLIAQKFSINLSASENYEMLKKVFEIKRVPLDWLSRIQDTYDQHVAGWEAVSATVAPEYPLEDFRYYFEFVVDLVGGLHPPRDV